MDNDINKTIKNLIAKGETGQALKILLDFTETEKTEWSYPCVLISNHYNQLIEKIIKGLIKFEDVDFTEINHRILMLLENGYSEKSSNSEEISYVPSQKGKEKKRYPLKFSLPTSILILFVTLLLLAMIYKCGRFEDQYEIVGIDKNEVENNLYQINEVYLSMPVKPEEQEPSYLITVEGQLNEENDSTLYGKYYYTRRGKWYDDWNLKASLEPEVDDGSWIITFGHKHLNVDKETFRFGLFHRRGFENDSAIVNVKFDVIKKKGFVLNFFDPD